MEKAKLTHWVPEEFVEKVLRGEGEPSVKKGEHLKPIGFWLSVNNSWEEWLDANWDGWKENKICLNATLSDDIKLFIIDSRQTFLNKFKEITNYDLNAMGILEKFEDIKLFHKKIKDYYDGMWLKSEPFWKHRLDFDFMYFYSWDCESIVVWNKNKIKFSRLKACLSQPST